MLPDAYPPPTEQELAMAHTAPADRALLSSVLAFDRALGRAVAAASEPLIGQLRLAWWRDALRADPADQPRGNPQLDALSSLLGESLPDLVGLVDGWEALLLANPLDAVALEAFVAGRVQAWKAIGQMLDDRGQSEALIAAARCWALADLAAQLGESEARVLVVEFARAQPSVFQPLTRRLRPLAILAALSRRSIGRGGGPLLASRSDALVALRASLLGR